MKYFRRVRELDYGDVCKCLTCKQDFLHADDLARLCYCPHCGVRLDAEFTKRNPRYRPAKPPRDYELDGAEIGYCYTPRLIIQQRKRLPDCFARVPVPEHFSEWGLVSHCSLGAVIAGSESAAVHMWNAFRKYCSDSYYDELRLLLRDKNNTRVLRHWSRSK